MKYEVQHYTLCQGWVNSWSVSENGTDIPHIFDTKAEAQAELNDFFTDIADEIKSGERAENEGYDQEEFRIVPLIQDDQGEGGQS